MPDAPTPIPPEAKRVLAKPVQPAAVNELSLPESHHFHWCANGRIYASFRTREQIPKAVADFILQCGEEDAEKILKGG